MRVEHYERDLWSYGYLVVASTTDEEDMYNAETEPIKMALTGRCRTSWEGLASCVGSDMFYNTYDESNPENRDNIDFCADWFNILCDKRQDWQLSAFSVSVGLITLYFVRPESHGTGFLWIRQPYMLRLLLEGPKTRWGFTPQYLVYINHSDTRIEEDQGYMRREIQFMYRDAAQANIFHPETQRMEITEYVGI